MCTQQPVTGGEKLSRLDRIDRLNNELAVFAACLHGILSLMEDTTSGMDKDIAGVLYQWDRLQVEIEEMVK